MNLEAFNPETEFKKFHIDNREKYCFEIRQKQPSENLLEQFAQKILEIVEKWQSMNKYSKNEVISARHLVDIFISDFSSDLEITNDKKYRTEWEAKYRELKGIQNDFVNSYKQSVYEL